MEKSAEKFDIFSGQMDKNALWLETVEGLANARERMQRIAAENPGRYFIFSSRTHSILAQIETRPGSSGSARATGSAG